MRIQTCLNADMVAFSSPTWQAHILPKATRMAASRAVSLILPRLYLSSLFSARDESQLRSLGITHVISVLEQTPKFPRKLGLKTLHIPLADTSDANILDHLDTTTDFIKTALAENEENKVLVHCLMGISRSATVVCAYLIATTSMPPNEAMGFVVSKRAVICPNLGFRQQLDTYAARYGIEDQRFKDEAKRKSAHVSVAERIRRFRALALGGS
ncbi:unnamed protein product [Somion occarium]|uniref:Protein-tyrosine-phosphatase n=1 Tax=Somion occarium TaxID=3059160 RepID=A0ABP1E5N8_9APHY